MTIAAARSPARLTYARARLWLGIAGVGGTVALATATIALDLPVRLLEGDASAPLASAIRQVIAALLVPTVLLFPLDVIGGAVVVRERPGAAAWTRAWARGVVVQLVAWTLAATLLLAAGRAGRARAGESLADAAALAAFVLLQLALVAARPWLARLVASFGTVSASAPEGVALRAAAHDAGIDLARMDVVASRDTGFVGGWTGFAAGRLWVPAHWTQLSRPALVAQLVRRVAVAPALHARGVAGALAFNTAGMALVLTFAPGAGATSAAALVTTIAWMVLWSFLGALLLPTPSRAAVHAADASAARVVGADAVRAAVAALDRWQDDEAERPPGVERVFHPVPARAGRLERLTTRADQRAHATTEGATSGAHMIARHALYLAWGAMSPLSRAVHCNVGRPALWVMWPGD